MNRKNSRKHQQSSQSMSQQSLNYSQVSIQPCQLQMCLLHCKVADIICLEDKVMICSKCALFGQHKGHDLENTQKFTQRIKKLDQSINQMMHKLNTGETTLRQNLVQKYVTNIFNQKKLAQENQINIIFDSILQMVKQTHTQLVFKLHQLFDAKKQAVIHSFKDCSDLILSNCYQWKQRVDKFKKNTKCQKQKHQRSSFSTKLFEKGAYYFDSKAQQSQILQTVQFLIYEIDSQISLITNKAQNIANSIVFSPKIGKDSTIKAQISVALSNLDIVEKQIEQSILVPLLKSGKSSFEEIKNARNLHLNNNIQQEQVNLLDITNQKFQKNQQQESVQFQKADKEYGNFRIFTKRHPNNFQDSKNQEVQYKYIENNRADLIGLKISRNSVVEKASMAQSQQSRNFGFLKRNQNQRLIGSISKERKQDHNKTRRSITNRNNLIQSRQKRDTRDILRGKSPKTENQRQYENQNGLNFSHKLKKLQLPQKYEKMLEDLRNDRAQIVDFGGAQLGDDNVRLIIDLLLKSRNVRVLKLVRNKISDDLFPILLKCCLSIGIVSLNLGQNILTENSLDIIQKQAQIEESSLKNITLSLNKINRRNVKQRIQEMSKKGVLISI